VSGEKLRGWYERAGRHDLPWRLTRDRWAVLVSEVMLQQTQVARVLDAWPWFIARFPSPEATATAGAGAVIAAWDRLGYPRRARWLWQASTTISDHGWPDDLCELPGVGRYTAGAVRSLADDVDVPAIEVNVRRVVERVAGRQLSTTEAEAESVRLGRGLPPRDRLLALMDVGALLCRPRDPACATCPLRRQCATRGPLDEETRHRQKPFEGSFRQRRGQVMARLRAEPRVELDELDREALTSLVADGLAVVTDHTATLPT
jgi:A/G-specific adenine glycosylase